MTDPRPETITVLNLITLPASAVDTFVEAWSATSASVRDAPGFRGTRLLRALSSDDPYQIVNVAEWDTVEQWRAALSALQDSGEQRRRPGAAGTRPQHAFYRVVAVVPDPLAPGAEV